ncbi:hypothetical protein BOX15_Mlig029421g1, partial [Macrostomum lignano]
AVPLSVLSDECDQASTIFEDIDGIAAKDAGAPPVQYAKISNKKHRLIIDAIDRGYNNRSIANLARRQEIAQAASLGR